LPGSTRHLGLDPNSFERSGRYARPLKRRGEASKPMIPKELRYRWVEKSFAGRSDELAIVHLVDFF
jgi:hypothetical protein